MSLLVYDRHNQTTTAKKHCGGQKGLKGALLPSSDEGNLLLNIIQYDVMIVAVAGSYFDYLYYALYKKRIQKTFFVTER